MGASSPDDQSYLPCQTITQKEEKALPMNPNIQVGDIVKLKSDSVPMVVSAISSYYPPEVKIHCSWFDWAGRQFRTETFIQDILTVTKPSDSSSITERE